MANERLIEDSTTKKQSTLEGITTKQEKEMSNLFQQEKLENLSSDEEKEILKKLSARLVDQKQNGGIEILEGNQDLCEKVCFDLSHLTDREIIRVQCSEMDPSDMFISATMKKGETFREPADWIKMMQKPGTIVLFDGIDELSDQCSERLHSLFDKSKSVYDPQLGKIKANSDCLFLGTKNSHDRTNNPIISRSRILQVSYHSESNES